MPSGPGLSGVSDGDKVSRVGDDDGQCCHRVAGIPDRGQQGSPLNDPVLFWLLSELVGVISSQRNDLADRVEVSPYLVVFYLHRGSLDCGGVQGALFRREILVDNVELHDRGLVSFLVASRRTSYATSSAPAASRLAPAALR